MPGLPKHIKIRPTNIAAHLHIAVVANPSAPTSPLGVAIALEMPDGRRYASLIENPDTARAIVEKIIASSKEVWPEGARHEPGDDRTRAGRDDPRGRS